MLQKERFYRLEKDGSGVTRRQFLQTASTAVLGFAALQTLGCETNIVEPLGEGLQIPFLTPVQDFFVRVGAEVSIPDWQQPSIPRSSWSLAIDGLVSTSVQVTYDDLIDEAAAGNAITILKTMRCVIDTNEVGGLIGTALWTGVPLDIFTDRASVSSNAVRFRVYGADGFTNNFRIERVRGNLPAQLSPPILVTHMNGQLLPEVHGGPVRLLLSESFGYKNIKWIERIEAVNIDEPFGTYQDAGFVDDGELRVISKITEPIGNDTVQAGLVRTFGIAVSGSAPIDRVELSVDGGAWETAEFVSLADIQSSNPNILASQQVTEGFSYPFRSVWVQWYADIELSAGDHEVRVRAVDSSGQVQPESDLDISDSINAIPSITVTAI